jgi:hypothetical protein
VTSGNLLLKKYRFTLIPLNCVNDSSLRFFCQFSAYFSIERLWRPDGGECFGELIAGLVLKTIPVVHSLSGGVDDGFD